MTRTGTSIVVVVLLATSCLAAQSSSELYQRARMLEETGRAGEAIKVYSQVVSQAKQAGDRALAAKAQFRIAVLHKRLGRNAESQRAFKTVVGEYSDQTEVAARAQAKLVTAIGAREKPALFIKRTGPSADGQFLASFIFPKGHFLSAGAFDSRRQRFYLVTQKMDEAKEGRKLGPGQRQVVRMVYWPSTLVVIDAKTQTVFKTIWFPVYLGDVAYNPTNDKLYASAVVAGHVRVIDPETFNTTAVIRVPKYPAACVVNPITDKIYVPVQGYAGNDKLFVIDGASHSLSGPFDLGGSAGRAVVNQTTNRVYVGADDRTRVFRGEDNSVLGELPDMYVIAVDHVQNRLYALAVQDIVGNKDLLVLDGNTHATVATFHYGDGIETIDLDPNSSRLYVPLLGRNQVAVIDTTTLKEINRIAVAGYPKAARVSQTLGPVFFYAAEDSALRAVSRERLEPENVPEEFVEEFDVPELDSEWDVRKGLGSYSLKEQPGVLRFQTAIPAGSAPYLTLNRKFRGENWTLETKVRYFTGTTGGGRTLRFAITFGSPPGIKHEAPNAVIIGRYRDSWTSCCPGNLGVQVANNGTYVSLGPALALNANETYYWRIIRAGNSVTVEASSDGVSFTIVGTHDFGSQIEGLVQYFSMSFNSHANNDAFTDYDYVRLTKRFTQ